MTEHDGVFVGWARKDASQRWFALARGCSAEAVLTRILDVMVGGDRCVVVAGVDPNDWPRRPDSRP
jgi:hypothetical protein